MTLRSTDQFADDYIQGGSDVPIDDEDRSLTAWEDVKIACSIRDAEWERELKEYPSKYCPYCADTVKKIKQIIEKNKDTIKEGAK